MTLATLGWAVVHSLWQCTLLAGLAALVLSVLPDRRTRTRHFIAYATLIVMVIVPIATAVSAADFMGESIRRPLSRATDDTIGLQSILSTRAVVVPAAAMLWLVGLTVYIVRVGREWRRARQLQRLDLDEAGQPVEAVVEELRSRLSVRTAVNVHRSRRATVPMVLGWLRPVILLPSSTAASLAPRQLRAVLAHELAHVRRRDYLANLIQMAAETMLFHHPAARWISHRIRTEREYCCDDVAISVGEDAVDYARALAALDDARDDCRLAVAAASGTLLDRIQRIAGQPRPVLTPIGGAVVLIVASALSATLLAMSTIIPPGLPLDVKLRSKMSGPMNSSGPPPGAVTLPRRPK